MLTLLLAASIGADPAPQFVVVNNCPQTFVVVNRIPAKPACICGPSCACAAGVCPACPAAQAQPGTLVTASGRTIRWTGSTYVYADESVAAPVAGGCANGSCGAPATGFTFRRR